MRKTKWGKGTKIIAVADGAGLPVAISVGSASPHEVRLTEDVLEARFVEERPYCMVMKFKDGQVSELYEYYDQLNLMTQLGLI